MKKRIFVAAVLAVVVGFCALQKVQAGSTSDYFLKQMLLSGRQDPKSLFDNALIYLRRLEDPNEIFYTPKLTLFNYAKLLFKSVKDLIGYHEKGEITFPEDKLIEAAEVDKMINYIDKKIAELQ